MPSRKRSRTPPAAPAPAPAAPVPAAAAVPAPSLRETFARRHFIAGGLVVLASIPALLAVVWDTPTNSNAVAVPAVIVLTHRRAHLRSRAMDRGNRAGRCCSRSASVRWLPLTAPAAPLGLLLPTLFAAVLEFKRGWGAASALVLGSGVAYALFGIEPSHELPVRARHGLAGAGRARHAPQTLAGSGHAETTVLGRGRW